MICDEPQGRAAFMAVYCLATVTGRESHSASPHPDTAQIALQPLHTLQSWCTCFITVSKHTGVWRLELAEYIGDKEMGCSPKSRNGTLDNVWSRLQKCLQLLPEIDTAKMIMRSSHCWLVRHPLRQIAFALSITAVLGCRRRKICTVRTSTIHAICSAFQFLMAGSVGEIAKRRCCAIRVMHRWHRSNGATRPVIDHLPPVPPLSATSTEG